MKWQIYALILLLIVPVQTTIMDGLSVQGIKPDLGFIAVCLIGFKMGEIDGLVMGALIGILLDLFSGGMLGTNLLTKPIVGWISGMVGRTVIDIRLFLSIGILMGLSLVSGLLIYLLLQLFRGGMDLFATFRWIILPQALYDAAVGAILLNLLSCRWKVKQG